MANLAALLDQEASTEINAIISEAETRASEIVAEARERAEAHLAQKKRATEVQTQASLVRAKSAAQLEASSLKLRAQHAAVEAVFAEAGARLRALVKDRERYPDILRKLLAEAASALGEGQVGRIIVNPQDRKLVSGFMADLKLEADLASDDAVLGGVRAKAKGASVSVENTLADRLARAREEMAGEVAQTLLGKAS
ncbi:MAG: V-type ATP synthase subunit E [Deinococcota bacterium]|jgi:vacuolar-type H+-ATPase subunit E/Vma4|nr:V-type ATP synthase subunit E [Deinococcota bacterium]